MGTRTEVSAPGTMDDGMVLDHRCDVGGKVTVRDKDGRSHVVTIVEVVKDGGTLPVPRTLDREWKCDIARTGPVREGMAV